MSADNNGFQADDDNIITRNISNSNNINNNSSSLADPVHHRHTNHPTAPNEQTTLHVTNVDTYFSEEKIQIPDIDKVCSAIIHFCSILRYLVGEVQITIVCFSFAGGI